MSKLTEADVLALLRERHTRPGNGGGGEFAFLTHVRNRAGFNATRTFDAVAINLWPSKGLTIEIFEVKVSRSDWLRELKKPDKAAPALALGDYFSVVAPAGCVKPDELPERWGLIEVHTRKSDCTRCDGHGNLDYGGSLDGFTRSCETCDNGTIEKRTLRQKVAPIRLSAYTRLHAPIPREFVIGLLRAVPEAIPGFVR